MELISGGIGLNVFLRKNCYKLVFILFIVINILCKIIFVKLFNLFEIKFNSYNNVGMLFFLIIIYDELIYVRSFKNVIKVFIVINLNVYDNLVIYKSFFGISGEFLLKERIISMISYIYEEIEIESKVFDNIISKFIECF